MLSKSGDEESCSVESSHKMDEKISKDLQEIENKKTTYLEGFTNNFRATIGTGILSIPIAFKQAGYIGAVIGILYITIITNYCALVLVNCQRELIKRNKDMVKTYQGTVQAAFSSGPKSVRKMGRFFVTLTNLFLLIGQIGCVCVDLVFISSNLKAASQPYLNLDLRYSELIVFLPILAVGLIPNMKKLALLSSLGLASFLSSFSIIFYYIFSGSLSFEGKNAFGTLNELPQYMGTIFFSSVTIAIVLPMENEMKKPGMLQGPFGILNSTSYLCTTLYILFGLVGYLKYGDNAADSITLNLPSSDWLSLVVQIFLSLSAFTSMAIVMYIGINVIWDDYMDKRITKNRTFWNYVLRIGFVISTLMVSLLIPNLQLLLSSVGIILHCTLSTTMPVVINFLTYYNNLPSKWAYIRKFWFDVVVSIFTIFVLYVSIASKLSTGSE